MAGETQLQDAKITLKLDVTRALNQINTAGRPRDERGLFLPGSRPGERPPSPGQQDHQRDQEDRERRRKRRPRQRRGGGFAIIPAGRRARGAIVGVVKTLAAAAALQVVADAVPAMIQQRLSELDITDVGQFAILKTLETTVGMPLSKISQVLNAAQSLLPAVGALIGTGKAVAVTNAVAGTNLDVGGVAVTQAKVAAAQAGLAAARRRIVGKSFAKQIMKEVDGSELLKPIQEALFGSAQTSK